MHRQARGDPDYASILKRRETKDVVFVNVQSVFRRDEVGLVGQEDNHGGLTVVVREGRIQQVCQDECEGEIGSGLEVVDLKGGSILPG